MFKPFPPSRVGDGRNHSQHESWPLTSRPGYSWCRDHKIHYLTESGLQVSVDEIRYGLPDDVQGDA